MNKLIRDGSVAVIIANNFGAGWYSAHGVEDLLYNPSIIEWLENKEHDKILVYLNLKYPNLYDYRSSFVNSLVSDSLIVVWVPVGECFRIHEYDGSESVVLQKQEKWLTA